MRRSTAIVATLVAASSLAISLRIGDLATQENIAPDNSAAETGPTEPVVPNPDPTTTTSESPAPKPDETTAPVESKPKPVTKNSDVIEYKYGVLQISVTALGSEITSVEVIKGDFTNGRAEAYLELNKRLIQQQSLDIGNVSGATYTTEAYKIAIENALRKF